MANRIARKESGSRLHFVHLKARKRRRNWGIGGQCANIDRSGAQMSSWERWREVCGSNMRVRSIT